jgi:hypothetical protein
VLDLTSRLLVPEWHESSIHLSSFDECIPHRKRSCCAEDGIRTRTILIESQGS